MERKRKKRKRKNQEDTGRETERKRSGEKVPSGLGLKRGKVKYWHKEEDQG